MSRRRGEGRGVAVADTPALGEIDEPFRALVDAATTLAASYRIVECSSARRSNMRTEPSAPTEAKTSRVAGDQATSYTSRSCAMSCVIGTDVEMSQTVQVWRDE